MTKIKYKKKIYNSIYLAIGTNPVLSKTRIGRKIQQNIAIRVILINIENDINSGKKSKKKS